LNPDVQFICTVSPIRHTRDSLIGNSRSKAHLLSALHNVIAEHPKCEYFPSYEIMIDDLRDYRYYKDDFIHPTSKALQYIWEIFLQTYTDTKTRDKLKRIEKVIKQNQHRQILSSQREN